MKALGYNTGIKTRRPNIVSNLYHTMPKKKKPENSNDNEGESFENLQLKKRIAGLEKQLKDAELKAIAFSTMVDIAEKEFNIQLYETSSFVFLFFRFQRQSISSLFLSQIFQNKCPFLKLM